MEVCFKNNLEWNILTIMCWECHYQQGFVTGHLVLVVGGPGMGQF